eukprot:c19092_g1_i2 orf=918-1109(-)
MDICATAILDFRKQPSMAPQQSHLITIACYTVPVALGEVLRPQNSPSLAALRSKIVLNVSALP